MFSSKHPVARWNAAPSKDTPDVVTVILTQPPKPGPKNGGQMPSRQSPPKHFRRTCQAVHWNSPEHKAQVLELHHFTKKKDTVAV